MPTCTTIAKNTTRLQNKYHPELSENLAVWNLTTKDSKKLHSSRWAGVAEMQRREERHGKTQRSTERGREVWRLRVAWKGMEMGMGGPTSTCGG